MKKSIYLDYAAATPLDSAVLAKMKPYFTDNFYNPSATYLAGQQIAKDIAAARTQVAKALGVRPIEIIYTSGATEANNLAIQGIMSKFPDSEITVSSVEHASVLEVARKFKHNIVNVKPDGRLDLVDLEKQITDITVIVSVMFANNEIGTIMPIKKIADIIQKVRSVRIKSGNKLPLYFHSDASQAPCYLDLHINRLGVDLLSLNGGKIYGPKQSGCLYIKTGIELNPLILGGGQERGFRSGTENVANIIGFSESLSMTQATHKLEAIRIIKLRDEFIDLLMKAIPGIITNGSTKYRLPNNIHITIPGIDNERAMMELDEKGILCGVGSACSASDDEPSHVLKAIGLSDKQAQSSLRFTIGKDTKLEELKKVVKELNLIVGK